MCGGCRDEHYTECYECGDLTKDENVVEEDGVNFCKWCHEDIYKPCTSCGETHRKWDMQELGRDENGNRTYRCSSCQQLLGGNE